VDVTQCCVCVSVQSEWRMVDMDWLWQISWTNEAVLFN